MKSNQQRINRSSEPDILYEISAIEPGECSKCGGNSFYGQVFVLYPVWKIDPTKPWGPGNFEGSIDEKDYISLCLKCLINSDIVLLIKFEGKTILIETIEDYNGDEKVVAICLICGEWCATVEDSPACNGFIVKHIYGHASAN
jgi:hypothetical protein